MNKAESKFFVAKERLTKSLIALEKLALQQVHDLAQSKDARSEDSLKSMLKEIANFKQQNQQLSKENSEIKQRLALMRNKGSKLVEEIENELSAIENIANSNH